MVKDGKRILTGVLVLALLLSVVSMIPMNAEGQAPGTNGITFNVIDSGGTPINGAEWELYETHELDPEDSGTTNVAGLGSAEVGAGYYYLVVGADGYYDQVVDVFRFDATEALNLGTIVLDVFDAVNTLTINVTGTGSVDVTAAIADVSEQYEGLYSDEATDNDGDIAFTVDDSTYRIVLTAEGYVTNVTTATVSGDDTVDVTMEAAETIQGFASTGDGLEAYLVSMDDEKEVESRIITASVTDNYFTFDAYEDDFYLFVDADGKLGHLAEVTLNGTGLFVNGDEVSFIDVDLEVQGAQVAETNITFADDSWEAMDLMQAYSLEYDEAYPGLPYNYLPMRMQIDLLGNGNGTIEAFELENYTASIEAFGPEIVSTHDLVWVNDVHYLDVEGEYDFIANLTAGAVNDTSSFDVSMSTSYEAVEAIEFGEDVYYADLFAAFDDGFDNVYGIALPGGYELTDSNESASVNVEGYVDITVDPAEGDDFAWIGMEFDASQAPEAVGAVIDDDNTYAVLEDGELVYYILANGTEVTFSGAGSFDANGNPLTYVWDFGDGESVETEEVNYDHIYSASAFDLTVNLTVVDVAGLSNHTEFSVKVDGVPPTAVIGVEDMDVSSGSITVDQNDALVFQGGDSSDLISDEGEAAGRIVSWNWDFGDDTEQTVLLGEDTNVTHAFEDAGTYTVVLNVTDAVGHYSTSSLEVVVNDVTSPDVVFVIEDDEGEQTTTAQENVTLTFDASDTTDDSAGDLTYTWDFGDDTNATGAVVDHAYEAIGTFTVTLSVEDASGNVANLTKNVVITSSDRPDLRIVDVTIDPSAWTEGESGTFTVNVTNAGNADAQGFTVEFFKIDSKGERQSIGSTPYSATLAPGEYAEVEFSKSFGSQGNYTVSVEVSTEDEINDIDNTDSLSVKVDEAGWKAIALYGGIFAVIIVIIVLVYFRKKLPVSMDKVRRSK